MAQLYHTFPQPEIAATSERHPNATPAKRLWRIFSKPQPPPVKSLAAKLAEVCEAVGGVGKLGKNSDDGYHYQRWRDIAAAVRGEMAKRGLVIIPGEAEILSEQRFPTQTIKHGQIDTPLVEVKIKRNYRVTDGINSLFGWGMGVGQDYRDKALYKAETGCLKYFLRGMFLIPDIEDDPEEAADHAQAEIAAVPVGERIDRAKQENYANAADLAERAIRTWNTLCVRHGKTVAQRRAFLLANFGVKTIVEVKSKLDYDKAIIWASNREELGETLAASVEAVKAQPIVQALESEEKETPIPF